MNCFELDQAQQLFPELVERARRGENIIITERNQPVVKFVAVEQITTTPAVPTKRRRPGSAKGLVHISDDFDEPLEDFREYM
ncbi:MAG: type II toxin-antitoxin system prevent-host-death family antitoxin [Gemmatimonadetes bacterium]|nr:type II toxin-antitoxin system prevent-host-death family antitoxin [Gemmatimonadota bacterium]